MILLSTKRFALTSAKNGTVLNIRGKVWYKLDNHVLEEVLRLFNCFHKIKKSKENLSTSTSILSSNQYSFTPERSVGLSILQK